MAKDKIRLLLKGVSYDDIVDTDLWGVRRNDDGGYYKYGSLWLDCNGTFLKLMRNSYRKGDLFIDCNPSRIKYGKINSSNRDVSFEETCEILDDELSGVFKNPNFFKDNEHNLKFSQMETYVDIRLSKLEADSLFEFISKIDIPPWKVDHEFTDDGTVYFYKGKEPKTGNSILKVYKKHNELTKRGHEVDNSLGIIRIELVLKSRQLNSDYKRIEDFKDKESYRVFCKMVEDPRWHMGYKTTIDYEGMEKSQVLSSELYQFQKLYEVIIEMLNLNKKIVTKDDLMNAINSTQTPKWAEKLCNYVKHINRKPTKIDGCDKTLSRYKEKILDMGYHYRYNDMEIHPIHLEELFFKQDDYKSAA